MSLVLCILVSSRHNNNKQTTGDKPYNTSREQSGVIKTSILLIYERVVEATMSLHRWTTLAIYYHSQYVFINEQT